MYGIEVYGNTYSKYLHKLYILNNKLLRILQNAPLDTPISQLYINFNTLPLPDLHNYQILKFIHKYIHQPDELPAVFSLYYNRIQIK